MRPDAILQRLRRVAPLVLALLIGGVLGMWLAPSEPAAPASAAGETATVWTCSMHPQVRESQPGSCPLCGMDLIPATSSAESSDPSAVVLSERARTLARLRTTAVRPLAETGSALRLLGRLEPAETARRTVTSWISGRVDQLSVATTGTDIRRGQVVARLYSPEVYTAHQDLLTARDQVAALGDAPPATRAAAEAALRAARERLQLLGTPEAELAALERAEAPTRSIAIRSPHRGTVLSRMVSEGQYVQTGTPLFEVASLDPLWVQLDAYEQDLSRLERGQRVRLAVEALPGEHVEGRVSFIDPTVDPVRRTARVRVEVANPDGRLRPGFFVEAEVEVAVPAEDAPLVVPASAVLYTGRRSVVYVEQSTAAGLAYAPRVVRLGPRLGEVYPVLSGLDAGERVVSRGAFVIDADLQIRGGPSMLTLPDDHERAAEEAARPALSGRERDALAPVLRAYLALQTALAEDDLAATHTAAAQLGTAAATATLPAAADGTWGPLAASLKGDAAHIGHADSLAQARQHFLALSSTMQTALTRLGNPLDEEVHLAYCPMADGNRGAAWIQLGETIDNAYFGAAMRTCGELQATVPPDGHLELPSSSAAPAGQVP